MKLFVSPPFGSFPTLVAGLRSSLKDVVPILGTYTLLPRPGKLVQAIKTLRYDFVKGGGL